jgi:hypothetical protein
MLSLSQGVAPCRVSTDTCWQVCFEPKSSKLLRRSGANRFQSSLHDPRHWTQPRQNVTGMWFRVRSCRLTRCMCNIVSVHEYITFTYNAMLIFTVSCYWCVLQHVTFLSDSISLLTYSCTDTYSFPSVRWPTLLRTWNIQYFRLEDECHCSQLWT